MDVWNILALLTIPVNLVIAVVAAYLLRRLFGNNKAISSSPAPLPDEIASLPKKFLDLGRSVRENDASFMEIYEKMRRLVRAQEAVQRRAKERESSDETPPEPEAEESRADQRKSLSRRIRQRSGR
jgi:hypothetical protein